jgi:CRP-like cAMP-binding protein
MAIDAFVKPLLNLEIFQGLKPLQITEIARRAYRVVYKPGDLILQENEDGDSAIVIVSGDAVRIAGPAMGDPAENIPVGSLLGEMAMLIETRHSSTIIARGPVRALRIMREEVHAQMAEDPELADHFLRRITARLTNVLDELRAIDDTLAADVPLPPSTAGQSALSAGPPLH